MDSYLSYQPLFCPNCRWPWDLGEGKVLEYIVGKAHNLHGYGEAIILNCVNRTEDGRREVVESCDESQPIRPQRPALWCKSEFTA